MKRNASLFGLRAYAWMGFCTPRTGYEIRATDGSIGVVNDIELNPQKWKLGGIVLKDGRAGISKNNVITKDMINEISGIRNNVILTCSKDEILQVTHGRQEHGIKSLTSTPIG